MIKKIFQSSYSFSILLLLFSLSLSVSSYSHTYLIFITTPWSSLNSIEAQGFLCIRLNLFVSWIESKRWYIKSHLMFVHSTVQWTNDNSQCVTLTTNIEKQSINIKRTKTKPTGDLCPWLNSPAWWMAKRIEIECICLSLWWSSSIEHLYKHGLVYRSIIINRVTTNTFKVSIRSVLTIDIEQRTWWWWENYFHLNRKKTKDTTLIFLICIS